MGVVEAFQGEDGAMHVTGTHDVELARGLARERGRRDDIGTEVIAEFDEPPRRWWAVPRWHADAEEHEYLPVDAGTPGALAVTTWDS